MKEDLKIFLKYIFNLREFFGIIGNGVKSFFRAESLSQLFLILPILTIILMYFEKIASSNRNIFLIVLFFVLFLYFKYSIVYKGGEHRNWYRESKGIPSKKEAIREEFDLRKGDEKERKITENK